MSNTVVVTRHPALVEYLTEIGLIPPGTSVITQAGLADIAGKCVIGFLPLHLAALVESVITVPLNVPPELRGAELTLEQVRQFAGTETMYRVELVRHFLPRGGN